jgi:hypothetical protein
VGEDLLQAVAFQRHHALVETTAFHVFEGDCEPAVAQQLPLHGAGGRLLAEIRHAADAQLRGAIRDQQPDRARTLHLQGNATGAFLVGAEQHVERGGMAEERGDVFGIAAPVEHAPPGAGKAGQAPPDVEILEEEALNVVRAHGSKYIEHVMCPR